MNKDFKCDDCKDSDSENILKYNHVLYYLCDDCYEDRMKESDEDLQDALNYKINKWGF